MTDQLWCPECEKLHYRPTYTDDPDSCNECGTELEEEWPLSVRVKKIVGFAIALVVVGVVSLGPPAWAVWQLFSGKPLIATRTVTQTTTQYYGIVPDVVPLLMVWAMIMLIGWGMATGAFPRMR